ncbi:MAG: hypothetical protein JSU72_12245 [Deltaproteobacteria bacterium]|nr:MAG: hypothetical protein JSU72_12245 [Deltaproteobacteria bacterium]
MIGLFTNNHEIVVHSGFIYLPLLFDPTVEREVRILADREKTGESLRKRQEKTIIEVGRKYFVKAVGLESLLRNYDQVDADLYEELKRAYLPDRPNSSSPGGGWIDKKLKTIIFKIMPYFVRSKRVLERGERRRGQILDLIAERIDVPPTYRADIDALLDTEPMKDVIGELERRLSPVEPPGDGVFSTSELREWLGKALKARILEEEKDRLNRELQEREEFVEANRNLARVMFYIAERGWLEMDGCGFTRIGNNRDYLVYKRTGEYVLTDYYGRSYLFPDCRVAVSTCSPFKPVVIEKYKHPFLYAHRSMQEICMRGFIQPQEFSAENIINVLEEAINALLYGYDGRRRNGYHSLDPTRVHVKTIEFVDHRVQKDSPKRPR